MDYYKEKYDRMCIQDSEDYAVDIIIKGNKVYKVKNYRWTIELNEFSEFIDELTIDKDYVLFSSHSEMTTLVQPATGNYINLQLNLNNETGEKYWQIEYVEPEIISSI